MAEEQDQDFPELYEEGRSWRRAQAIIGAIVLIVIIGFLIWFFFFRGHSNTPTVETPDGGSSMRQGEDNGSSDQSESGNSESGNSSESESNSSSSDNSAGSTSESGSGESNSSSQNSSSSSQQLTNTGPGDMVAIFIGACIVGTLAYQIKFRRQLNRR